MSSFLFKLFKTVIQYVYSYLFLQTFLLHFKYTPLNLKKKKGRIPV